MIGWPSMKMNGQSRSMAQIHRIPVRRVILVKQNIRIIILDEQNLQLHRIDALLNQNRGTVKPFKWNLHTDGKDLLALIQNLQRPGVLIDHSTVRFANVYGIPLLSQCTHYKIISASYVRNSWQNKAD